MEERREGTHANQRIAALPSALRVTSTASSSATGRSVTLAAPMIAIIANNAPVSFGFTVHRRASASRDKLPHGARRTCPDEPQPERGEPGEEDLARHGEVVREHAVEERGGDGGADEPREQERRAHEARGVA